MIYLSSLRIDKLFSHRNSLEALAVTISLIKFPQLFGHSCFNIFFYHIIYQLLLLLLSIQEFNNYVN